MSRPLSFDPIEEAGRQWRRRWGGAAATPMMAVTSVMRAQQVMLGRLNELLAPHELSFSRYEALMLLFLSRTGSLPLGRLGARLQVHPTSVTSLIDGLQRSGYVARSPHPSDRRATLATITERGRAVAAEATEALNAARFGVAGLGQADLRGLTDVLRTLRVDAGDFAAGAD